MRVRIRQKPLAARLITYLVPFLPPSWAGVLDATAGRSERVQIGASDDVTFAPGPVPRQGHASQPPRCWNTPGGVGVPTPASACVSFDKRPAAGGG